MDRKMIARELLGMAKELMAIEFPTQEALDKYLKDHPDADRSNHRVVKEEKKDTPAKKEDSVGQGKYTDKSKEEQRELEKKVKKHNQVKYNFANALRHSGNYVSKTRVETSLKKYHDAVREWEKEVDGTATSDQKTKIKKIHEKLDKAEKTLGDIEPHEGNNLSLIRQNKEVMGVYNLVNSAWHDKLDVDGDMGRYFNT